MEVSKDKLVLDSKNNKSDVIDIYISSNIINTTLPSNSNITSQINSPKIITMDTTSSLAKDGKLVNITASFSQDTLSIEGKPATEIGPSPEPKTSLEIHPTNEVIPGNYTLTISAKHDKDVTVSKIVDLEIR